MSKIKRPSAFSSLAKRAKRGMRGYPVATVAFYGPDDKRASKCVASILVSDETAENDDGVGPMRKWFSDTRDLRHGAETAAQVTTFIEDNGAKSVVVSGIIGCPTKRASTMRERPVRSVRSGKDAIVGTALGRRRMTSRARASGSS